MLKIIDFFKKYWLFILLGALVIIVIALKISTFSSPRPSPGTTPTPSPSVTSLTPLIITGKDLPARTKFSGQANFLPKTATVYQGKKATLSEQDANNIAQKLSFTTSPTKMQGTISGNFYVWSSNEYDLSIWTESPKIDYSVPRIPAATTKEGLFPNQNEAQIILNNLFNQTDVKFPTELVFLKIKYFKVVATDFIESTLQEADFIQADFVPSLNNYPLLTSNLFEPPIFLRLNREDKILRFVYTSVFSNFTGVNGFPLKNRDQIILFLTTEGKIVDQDYSKNPGGKLEFIDAEFNQISLAYFEPPTDNIIQPIYVLSGTGALSNGQQTPITAFLPAINYEGAPLSPAPASRFKF